MNFSPIAIAAAKAHARAEYPKESCGFIKGDAFTPVANICADAATHDAENPDCACQLCAFLISSEDVLANLDAEAVIHSHPDGPMYPSAADMEGQMADGRPWGIIALSEDRVSEPWFWGDSLPIRPLIGREFMHGICDCYSLVRDVFRLGKQALAEQGIPDWPFEPITLLDYPRDDAWWNKDFDLYNLEAFKVGFVEIKREEARPGDAFLCKINSGKFNHGGLLIGNDLLLHHLPARLSRREPAGLWARHAGRWLRYVGEGSIYA